jgi:hypothetical protein
VQRHSLADTDRVVVAVLAPVPGVLARCLHVRRYAARLLPWSGVSSMRPYTAPRATPEICPGLLATKPSRLLRAGRDRARCRAASAPRSLGRRPDQDGAGQRDGTFAPSQPPRTGRPPALRPSYRRTAAGGCLGAQRRSLAGILASMIQPSAIDPAAIAPLLTLNDSCPSTAAGETPVRASAQPPAPALAPRGSREATQSRTKVPIRGGISWPHGRSKRPGRSPATRTGRRLAPGRDALRRRSRSGRRDGDDGHAGAHDRARARGTDTAPGRRSPARARRARCCGGRHASSVGA